MTLNGLLDSFILHEAALVTGCASAWEVEVQTCCESLRLRFGACDIVPVVVGLARAIASCASWHLAEECLRFRLGIWWLVVKAPEGEVGKWKGTWGVLDLPSPLSPSGLTSALN